MLQILADVFHLLAMLLLLFKIVKTKSCAGVSGRTQCLLAIVLLTQDLTLAPQSVINLGFRMVFAICAIITIILIYGPFSHTYDGKHDTFRIEILLIPCLVLALVLNYEFTWFHVLWAFSIYLEAIAIVPQIWLTDKVGYTQYMGVYLLALGIYSALNMVHWIIISLFARSNSYILLISGIAHTCFFIVFLFLECHSNKDEVKLVNVNVVDNEKPSPLDIHINNNDGYLAIQKWGRPDRW
ncbi:unnamed protein product [Hermetia illucens]|uniref:ER lumen protein-retaining receptor n=2 Tax=Hermetia illucens TaxID=343691 RepID=A0A7R8USY0_HERIL|nr:unnamed protein product [Hermetia illucens]